MTSLTPTAFAQAHPITDICFLVEDAERSIAFYTQKMGFRLRRRAPGFADFSGAGITLALWEIGHISEHTGISGLRAPPLVHKACGAFELPSPAVVDEAYRELSERGVVFQGPPADFVWNARCCYFADPDDNIWELYAWLDGGAVGDVDTAS
jgi:catechol 2,3-dioxygenase-like lactoylglutathione lyase family enzyme